MKFVRKSDGAVIQRNQSGDLVSNKAGTGWNVQDNAYHGNSIRFIPTGRMGDAAPITIGTGARPDKSDSLPPVETPRDKYDKYLAQARTAYTSPRAIREQTGPLTVEERNAAIAESRAATRAIREKGEEGLRSLGLSESQIKGSAGAMTRPAQERAWHYAKENNPNLMTAEELKQYIADYDAAEAERKRLLGLDIGALDEQIKEAKAAAKASHVRNTNRAGRSSGRGNTQTDADRQLATLREDRNKAAAAQKNARMEQTVADNQAFYNLVDSRMQNAPKQASEQIPYDRETQRILQEAGYSLADQKELLEARKWVKETQRYDEAYQHAVEMATYHPFTASVVSVPANLAGGVTGMVGLVGQKIEGRDIMNVKGPGMGGYAYTQGARNTVSQNLDAATGGKLASFLYQTGMSMADSAAIMAMAGMGIPAGVGTALLGASAATDATVQAKLNGADDVRALATGLAAGAAEYIFEKFSIDRFMKLDRIAAGQQMKQILKTELKNIGKQALTEGSEEVFTDLANFITDAIINGGGSEYNRAVRDYMAQGMDEKAARSRATNDFIAQLALSGAGGALSGGAFGSVGGVVNIGRTAEVNAAVRDVYGADTAALVEEALALDPTNKTALAAQERLNEGKTVSADMQRAIVEQNQEIIERQAAQAAEMEEINGESGGESAERYDRLAGREAVAGMAQAASEKARQQAAAADSIRAAVETARVGETKTVTLGISSAVADSTVRVVPDNLYTEEMRRVAAENAGNGVETVFVVGPIRLQDGGMARGWISDDGKKVVIRADHAEFTVSQLARHEDFHRLEGKDPGLADRVAADIMENYSTEALLDIMAAYCDAYGLDRITDADKRRQAEGKLIHEICADAYAGMNAVGQEIGTSGDASRFRDIAEARAEEARGVENEGESESLGEGHFSRDINPDRAGENVKKAEAYFGTTYRISEAGYLLTDGKMLDFSGRHEGGPGGHRTVDHRDIKDALGDDYGGDGYSDGLIQFMREGNVRLMPENGGINMIVKPNPKQMQTLDRYISHFRGEVIIDFDDEKGDTVNSVEYSRGTYSKSILWAIEDYFDKGILPEKDNGSFSRDPVESLQKENERLREDLDKLAERKAYFKAQGQQTYETVSPAIIRNMAADYVKNTTLDAEDITADLQALGDFMHGTHKGMSSSERYAQAKAMAADIGRELVSHYSEVINPEDAAKQKRLRKELREHPMSVSREVKNDFDNWSEWRKANPGIAIKTDATPVDVRYSELREMFGETYFPSDIVNPADQLRQIARAVEMMGPRTENTKSYYAEAATEEMANQIIRDLIHPTKTDRLINRMKQQKKEAVAKAELADEMYYKRKTAEAVREQRDIRERERQKSQERVDRLVQQQKEATARRKEREKVRKFRPKIEKLHKELRKTLLHPTDSKYIPEQFRLAALDVLRIIDLSGENEGTKAKAKIAADLLKINDLYNDLKNEKGLGKDANLFYEYDEDTANNITALRQHLENTPVRELTADELEDVYTILHDIMVTFREARWQIGKAERKLNAQVGSAIAKEQIARKANMTPAQKKTAAYLRLSASPLRNVAYMASYNEESELIRLFNDLNEGIRKKNDFTMRANKLFDRFAGERMRKSATEEKDYTIGGETVRMTEMQAMELVLDYERELANGDTNHLQGGGAIIPDKKLMEKGKTKDAVRDGQKAKDISQKDVDGIYSTLDEWAKDYMDAARDFFNGMAQDAINEATMLTRHRKVATVKKYIPFTVDKGTIAQEIEGLKHDATPESVGMLKSVQKGASNALVLRGLNAIIDRHIEEVGRYYGLAAPIKNYNKAMGAHIGTGGYTAASYFLQDDQKLLDQVITELWAGRQHDSPNALTDFLDKLQDSFVKATLLNNISVTIKQAASYATAGLYVSQRALAPYQGKVAEIFLNSGSKANQALFAEIDSHTASHYMRRKGMSLQEAAMIAKDEGRVVRWMDENIKNPAANPLKWIQGMDVATTAALWLACKEQVRLDGGKETDSDYWDKVTELYEKVIEETQPMYDVLHRPEVQRNTNSLIRQLVMFRTQPLQNAGILWDAAGNYTQAKKTGKGVQAAKEKLQRAVLSQVASAAVFAAMKLISHAIRNRMKPYKDKEERLTLWSVTKTMLSDMASTGAGLLLPVGGEELFDIVKGGVKIATTGKTGYDVFTVPAVDQLNDWISDVDSLFKNLYDLSNDNLDIEKLGEDMRMVAFDAAAVAGIPARNVWNIVVGIIGNVTDIAGVPISWATDEENTTSGVKAAFDNGHYALGREKMEKIIQQKVDGGRTLTQARGDVRSTITGYFKPLYVSAYRKANKKEMERIRRALQATGLYDDLAETLADWVK